MKLKKKSLVVSSIKTCKKTSKGIDYVYYEADCGVDIDGKRIRICRAKRNDCIRAIEDFYQTTTDDSGASITSLTPVQLADASMAFLKLNNAKINKSITSIIDEYISNASVVCCERKLIDAYNEYFNSFSSIQEQHLKCVKARVGRFALFMPERNVSSIAANEVISFLDSLGDCSPKTWNNYKQYISSFFEWCAKKVRRYCVENPIKDLERKQIPYKVPEFATIDTVKAIFLNLANYPLEERDILKTYFALSFFCGMRRQEILRLSCDDVHLDNGSIFVRLPKGWTKGIPPRNFHITDTAIKILHTADWKTVLRNGINEKIIETHINKVRELGYKIPKNAGRHSFITYHVAAYGNPSLTEGIVGTSSKMRTSHYMGLADKASGEKYFSLSFGFED